VSVEQVRAEIAETADAVERAARVLGVLHSGVLEAAGRVGETTRGTDHPAVAQALTRLAEAAGEAREARSLLAEGVDHARRFAGAL
jgi:hypothetical protein